GVGEHDIREVRLVGEQAIGDSRLGIALTATTERVEVRGIEERGEALSIAGRLRKAMVEAAAPGACRVHEEAIEHGPSVLVRVESLVEEVTQEATGLRDAEAEPSAYGKWTRLVVLGVRHHVSHGRETEADHDGVTSAIDELVDL